MKKVLLLILVIILFSETSSAASRRLIPIVNSPHDAVDLSVVIPNSGVRIALYNYDPKENSGIFIVVKNGEIVDSKYYKNIVKGEHLELVKDCEIYVLEATENGVDLIFSCVYPYAVVVTNSIDLNLSSDFIDFLVSKGVVVSVISASDFEDYKETSTIIILGGPDAPEGIGGIVQGILIESEQAFLKINGNRQMYVKTNVWTLNQNIVIIAGSDRFETRLAVSENKEYLTV
jgi:hypothetical protein